MFNRPKQVATRQQGFTLAELIVATGIAALVLSLGVPGLSTLTHNSRQVSSSNELLSSLHMARDIAITRNTRVTVCPSATGTNCEPVDWHEGWILFVDNDANRAVGAGETILDVTDDVAPLMVDTEEFGQFLIYRPNGRIMVNDVRDNTGEFTLCDDRGPTHARVVVVHLSGRPRVSRYRGDGSAPVCS